MEQPKFSNSLSVGVKRAVAGSKRSQERLRELNFDPIERLVRQYEQLEAELTYQECLRDGTITELKSDGKPRAYRAEIHMSIYDKLVAIGDKLLRYKYGRVPETQIMEHKDRMPLVVNLTKQGDTYIINDEPDLIEDQTDGD